MTGIIRLNIEQPYLLYLGDLPRDRKHAEDVYNRMCDSFESITSHLVYPPSDGDIEPSGGIARKRPSALIRHMSTGDPHYSLKRLRLRAAQRYTIDCLVSRHGESIPLFSAIARALQLKSWKHAKAFHQIALDRKLTNAHRVKRIEKIRSQNCELLRALVKPSATNQTDLTVCFPGDQVNNVRKAIQFSNASKHFCKHCFLFLCGVHEDVHTTPRNPIQDVERDARCNDFAKSKFSKINACSPQCFLNDSASAPSQTDALEFRPWTEDEVCLLREAVVLYERDTCSIAIVLGSRTCREVNSRLRSRLEGHWAKLTYETSKEVRTEAIASPVVPPVLSPIRRPAHRQAVAKKSTSGISERRPQLVACDHVGECTMANCPCKASHRYCEARCGCNGARFCCKPGGGIVIQDARDCLQKAAGCQCKDGACNSDSCDCFRYGVACTPGSCRCDSDALPSQIRLRDRQCKNCDYIVGRHKRTTIGKSKIDGLGLFAGEPFQKGDVVGVYHGALWERKDVDAATLLGEELNRTYAFDINHDYSMDAALFGSKARFANHSKHRTLRNCESAMCSIRGDVCICLRATRNIEPGEEFLFDYKLTMEKAWMSR